MVRLCGQPTSYDLSSQSLSEFKQMTPKKPKESIELALAFFAVLASLVGFAWAWNLAHQQGGSTGLAAFFAAATGFTGSLLFNRIVFGKFFL
jgi:hypothetical protein